MKSSKSRNILFSLVLIASISSYLYINSVETNANIKCEAKKSLVDEEDKNSSELPDVKLIKKIIETGKQLVPAARL